jgi:hypothetical protein
MNQNNQIRCGDCVFFEYEDTEGTGVCAFHQTVNTCDAKACEDFIAKYPHEPLTDGIKTILKTKRK